MDFENDSWWDFDSSEIHFAGFEDDRRILFRITQIALTDYYGTVDSQQAAEELFDDNKSLIEDVALSVWEDQGNAKVILITSKIFARYAPSV